MRRSPATMIKALFGDTAVAALAACAFICPAIATAGVDTLCDQQTRDTATLDIPVDELALELIDVPGTNALMPVDLDIPIDLDDYEVELPASQLQIQRLFDQAHLESLPGTISPYETMHPPLVDLAEPVASDSKVESIDEPLETDTSDTRDAPPAVNTRVPGVSEDDLMRYRQRMYRTDI